MKQVRIRDLALVALASGLLAFELTSLEGALPAPVRAFAEQAVLGDMRGASRGAVGATASVLRGVGTATSHAVVGAVKGVARSLGTVTPPVRASGLVLLASRGQARGSVRHVHVVTLSSDACREIVAAGLSARRVRQICREVEATRRRSTL